MSLALSEAPKTGFLTSRHIFVLISGDTSDISKMELDISNLGKNTNLLSLASFFQLQVHVIINACLKILQTFPRWSLKICIV